MLTGTAPHFPSAVWHSICWHTEATRATGAGEQFHHKQQSTVFIITSKSYCV
jgi:hypothetical protein